MGFLSRLLFGPTLPKKYPTSPVTIITKKPTYLSVSTHSYSPKSEYYLSFKKKNNKYINDEDLSNYKVLDYVDYIKAGRRYHTFPKWWEKQQEDLTEAGKQNYELKITNVFRHGDGSVHELYHYLQPSAYKWEYKQLKYYRECPEAKSDLLIAENEGWILVRTSLGKDPDGDWKTIHFLKRKVDSANAK